MVEVADRNGRRRKKKKGGDKAVPRTTFADVAGVGPAKEELAEVGGQAGRAGMGRLGKRIGGSLPTWCVCGAPKEQLAEVGGRGTFTLRYKDLTPSTEPIGLMGRTGATGMGRFS